MDEALLTPAFPVSPLASTSSEPRPTPQLILDLPEVANQLAHLVAHGFENAEDMARKNNLE